MSAVKDIKQHIKKYIILVIFVIFLMLVSINAVYRYVSNIILDANIETMRELAEHDVKAISASIADRVSDAVNLGDSLASQSILSIQELHENLNAANYQLKTKKIYLLGSNGKLYSSNGTAKTDSDYDALILANPDGFLERLPSSSKKYNDGLLLIGRPITNFSVEGITFTYIITEIKLIDLASELSTTSYNGQGYSVIIDTEGNHIVSEAGELQKNAFDEMKVDTTVQGESVDSYISKVINQDYTAVKINYRGEDRICLTTHTPEGWILISVCPLSVFSEESNRITSLFAFLTLFFVLSVVIILISIMRTQSRKQLEEHYEEIQKLNTQLLENQTKLEESVTEQESQLEEITNLNHELEEHQAQLEETTAEQESQLEEIAELNKSLSLKQEELEYTIKDLEESDGIIQAAGYGIWKFIFNSNGEVCGLIGNDKWAEIFGVDNDTMTPEERFAYYSNGLVGGLKDDAHSDYSDMRDGKLRSRVFAWNHPTKGLIYLSVGGTRHIAHNGDIQISGYVRDVTEDTLKQQKWENEIIEARKNAEEANSAKTSFLFNMSHDIRTPMNAIIGFRDLLEKHQEEPDKRTDYLKKIEDASTVLLSIINNVLEMARIEKGTIELDESVLSADQFNDTIYSIFHEMMAQKDISFTRRIDVQNNFVFCDPIKLREIFINILSNAYKYTNSGGSVDMHLKEIPSDRDGYVLYQTTITDTGIGMSEEFLPHLFDEFSRENNTTDAKVEGTGLGMPIVKRLVALMDGTIEVQSEKGKGTVFIVTIPHRLAEKANLANSPVVELDPNLFVGKRILLAEDNELNAEIALEILGEAGFIVDRAEDGSICVKMLEESPNGYYDLILMDIQMPNMNGYEATRMIRKLSNKEKSKIKIIAMTANAFEEDKREALNAGMNAHLAKPIDVSELMKTLAGILMNNSN